MSVNVFFYFSDAKIRPGFGNATQTYSTTHAGSSISSSENTTFPESDLYIKYNDSNVDNSNYVNDDDDDDDDDDDADDDDNGLDYGQPRMVSDKCFSVSSFISFLLISLVTGDSLA